MSVATLASAFIIPALLPAALGATILFGSLTVSSAVTGLISLLGGGAALALSPRKARGAGALPQVPAAQTVTTRASPVAHRFFGFGLLSDGGVLIFNEKEKNNYWHGYGTVVDCGPIGGILAVFADNDLVPLTTGVAAYAIGLFNFQTLVAVNFGPNVKWPNSGIKYAARTTTIEVNHQITEVLIGFAPAIFTEFRNATDAGAPSVLLRELYGDKPNAVVPNPTTTVVNWGPEHTARGLSVFYCISTIFATKDRFSVYPNGDPVFRFVRMGALVYDPRDNAQSFADKTTWKWSRNPALCRAWHATHEDGMMRTYDEVNWDSIAVAANDCDRVVQGFAGNGGLGLPLRFPGEGGQSGGVGSDRTSVAPPIIGWGKEPFARCDLQWDTGQERRDVEASIDITCDGSAFEDGEGRLNYWINKPEAPNVTLTMADISSIIEEPTGGAFSSYTQFVGQYVEPRTNFQKAAAPEVLDTDGVAAIGRHQSDLQHDGVQSFSQSYRLAHRAMRRVNPKRRLTITGGWSFLRLRKKRVVRLDCPAEGIVGDFWIDSPLGFSQTLERWVLKLSEIASDAYADVIPPRDPIHPLVSVTIASSTIIPAPAGLVVGLHGSSIQASVTAPDDATLTVYILTRETALALKPWTLMNTVLGQWAREGGPFAPGSYDVMAWFIDIAGATGALSAPVVIVVP